MYRACGNVKEPVLIATEVETVGRFACIGAKKVIRKYFAQVESSLQTPGGCAFKRSHKGCKVNRYRCWTRYSRAANELEGECKGPKGKVWFVERDIGPY